VGQPLAALEQPELGVVKTWSCTSYVFIPISLRGFQPVDDCPVVVLVDPPHREHEVRTGHLNQMIAQLVEVLPPGSAVALEAGCILDERILSEFETRDIRRYGDTRIAIKVVPDAPAVVAVPAEPRGPALATEALAEPEDDRNE
jgi:hypothetical protein